ncbi:DNA adenine methylase [Rhizobium beringeri]
MSEMLNVKLASNVVPLRARAHVENQPAIPARATRYPDLRYMGSKSRLLPWIFETLNAVDFDSVLDPFSGTGCVGYLFKSMDRRVVASDFMNFSSLVARATIANNKVHLDGKAIRQLIDGTPPAHNFIEKNFSGVFYKQEDLKFLDRVSGNIRQLQDPYEQALAFAAFIPLLPEAAATRCLHHLRRSVALR